MITNETCERIINSIARPSGKSRALLATMYKGFAANGTTNILILLEIE